MTSEEFAKTEGVRLSAFPARPGVGARGAGSALWG